MLCLFNRIRDSVFFRPFVMGVDDAIMLGGVVASAAGGIGSSISGGKMNKRAAKVARETNEMTERLNQQNNQFNADQAAIARDWQAQQRMAQNEWSASEWNRQAEYNSPLEQRKRLEAAGYNPYLFGGDVGNIGSSSASSGSVGSGMAASSSSPGPLQVPDLRPLDFSGVADAINSYYQNRSIASQTIGQDISNRINDQLGNEFMRSQIAKNLGGRFEWLADDYKNNRVQNANLLGKSDVLNQLKQVDATDTMIKLRSAQAFNERLQGEGQKIINKYLPEQQQAQLHSYAAQQFSDFCRGLCDIKSASLRVAEKFKTVAEAEGIRINNKTLRSVQDSYINAMNAEYKSNFNYYSVYANYQGFNAQIDSEKRYADYKNALKDFDLKDVDLQKARTLLERERKITSRELHSIYNKDGYSNFMRVYHDILEPFSIFLGGTYSSSSN